MAENTEQPAASEDSPENKQNSYMVDIASDRAKSICPLKLNPNYWLNERYVLILGSNTKINNVMDSFANFSTEWTNRDHPQIVHVTIVDEEEKHVRADYYKDYPFVETCISANIDEKEKISGVMPSFSQRRVARRMSWERI